MKIKLHAKDKHPQEGALVMVLHPDNNFLSIVLFKEGNWYVMPHMLDIDHINFQWIEMCNE